MNNYLFESKKKTIYISFDIPNIIIIIISIILNSLFNTSSFTSEKKKLSVPIFGINSTIQALQIVYLSSIVYLSRVYVNLCKLKVLSNNIIHSIVNHLNSRYKLIKWFNN